MNVSSNRPAPIPSSPTTEHPDPGERPSPAAGTRSVRRLLVRAAFVIAGLLTLGNLGILGLTLAARAAAADTRPAVVGVANVREVDDHLWRGAHPGPEGFRALAAQGVTTVIDLRAERDAVVDEALMAELGVTVHRLPIRDGQTPGADDVQTFLDLVAAAPGRAFVHCGAGVGRAGTMSAAYLVATDQADGWGALARNLAVGPPSIEQITYVAGLDGADWGQPPEAVQAVSRFFDFPRRTLAVLRS